jgi:hypothetical protein
MSDITRIYIDESCHLENDKLDQRKTLRDFPIMHIT